MQTPFRSSSGGTPATQASSAATLYPYAPPATSFPHGYQSVSTLQAINQTFYTRVVTGQKTGCTAIRLYIGTSSGNICVAVYSDTGVQPLTRVSTSGTVASPGTGVQSITISPAVDIYPGMWISLSADNTTVSFGRTGGPALLANAMGTGYQYYENVMPAPATTTPASASFYAGFILIGA